MIQSFTHGFNVFATVLVFPLSSGRLRHAADVNKGTAYLKKYRENPLKESRTSPRRVTLYYDQLAICLRFSARPLLAYTNKAFVSGFHASALVLEPDIQELPRFIRPDQHHNLRERLLEIDPDPTQALRALLAVLPPQRVFRHRRLITRTRASMLLRAASPS
ncbi:unnamed protein product [Peniophora sp. CBMAI 1063]|nr:unnamed protein product [Peniophora sp. CBMAI 1063]